MKLKKEPTPYRNDPTPSPQGNLKEYVDLLPDDNGNALEQQVGGDHYRGMAHQPIEFIMANDLGFCEGNAIKYICRYQLKGGTQDLDKAIHYLNLLKESYNGNN